MIPSDGDTALVQIESHDRGCGCGISGMAHPQRRLLEVIAGIGLKRSKVKELYVLWKKLDSGPITCGKN